MSKCKYSYLYLKHNPAFLFYTALDSSDSYKKKYLNTNVAVAKWKMTFWLATLDFWYLGMLTVKHNQLP